MMKKRWIYCHCVLLLSLFLGISEGVTPASGQVVEPGARIGFSGGVCFNSESSSRSCWAGQFDFRWYRAPRGRDVLGQTTYRGYALSPLQQLRKRVDESTAIGIGGTVTLLTDTWPDKDPPTDPTAAPVSISKQSNSTDDHEPPQVKHRGTWVVTAEAFLPIPVDPEKFLLEPFVGVGIGHVREDASRMPDQSTVADQTFLVATYGIDVIVRRFLMENLDLRIQYRGLVFFPDNPVEYVSPGGRSFEVDLGSVNNASLLLGLGVRF